MRTPDETDLEILRLLSEDARRPYREIADHVDLTPPAVSDRVTRLEELGVIRQFTLDVDRTKLHHRVPVLVELTVDPEAVDRVYEELSSLEATEHLFLRFDGEIVAHLVAPDQALYEWIREALPLSDIVSYDVTPLAKVERHHGLDPADFAMTCVVCEKAVDDGGELARIDGDLKVFCCPSCRQLYEERYESITRGVPNAGGASKRPGRTMEHPGQNTKDGGE